MFDIQNYVVIFVYVNDINSAGSKVFPIEPINELTHLKEFTSNHIKIVLHYEKTKYCKNIFECYT